MVKDTKLVFKPVCLVLKLVLFLLLNVSRGRFVRGWDVSGAEPWI